MTLTMTGILQNRLFPFFLVISGLLVKVKEENTSQARTIAKMIPHLTTKTAQKTIPFRLAHPYLTHILG